MDDFKVELLGIYVFDKFNLNILFNDIMCLLHKKFQWRTYFEVSTSELTSFHPQNLVGCFKTFLFIWETEKGKEPPHCCFCTKSLQWVRLSQTRAGSQTSIQVSYLGDRKSKTKVITATAQSLYWQQARFESKARPWSLTF